MSQFGEIYCVKLYAGQILT